MAFLGQLLRPGLRENNYRRKFQLQHLNKILIFKDGYGQTCQYQACDDNDKNEIRFSYPFYCCKEVISDLCLCVRVSAHMCTLYNKALKKVSKESRGVLSQERAQERAQ